MRSHSWALATARRQLFRKKEKIAHRRTRQKASPDHRLDLDRKGVIRGSILRPSRKCCLAVRRGRTLRNDVGNRHQRGGGRKLAMVAEQGSLAVTKTLLYITLTPTEYILQHHHLNPLGGLMIERGESKSRKCYSLSHSATRTSIFPNRAKNKRASNSTQALMRLVLFKLPIGCSI